MSMFVMYGTLNVTGRGAYCAHCDNHGLVVFSVLDGVPVDHEFAGPCPMCEKGRTFNGSAIPCDADPKTHARVSDRAGGPWEFWNRHMVHEAVWSHGYTTQHRHRCRYQGAGWAYPCGRPTADKVCAHHEGVSEQESASQAAFSIPRLAELAGRVPAPKESPKRRVLTPAEKKRLAEVSA